MKEKFEPYQPTPEEVKKAEKVMTVEQEESSKAREWILRKLEETDLKKIDRFFEYKKQGKLGIYEGGKTTKEGKEYEGFFKQGGYFKDGFEADYLNKAYEAIESKSIQLPWTHPSNYYGGNKFARWDCKIFSNGLGIEREVIPSFISMGISSPRAEEKGIKEIYFHTVKAEDLLKRLNNTIDEKERKIKEIKNDIITMKDIEEKIKKIF